MSSPKPTPLTKCSTPPSSWATAALIMSMPTMTPGAFMCRAVATPSCSIYILAQTDTPYKVLDTTQLMGNGGIDYVYADNDARRVYVPRGGNTFVFDLDSHKYVGTVTNVGGHGVAIDTKTHHGFASSSPVGMFDTGTMEKIKDIPVSGRPDGILLEPFTGKVFIFSHQSPSITMIDPAEGTVSGTIDVGGAMEQAQSRSEEHTSE